MKAVISRYVSSFLRFIFVAVLVVVVMIVLNIFIMVGSCYYKKHSIDIDVDSDFFSSLPGNDEGVLLDRVKAVNIHVVPSRYGLADCFSVFSGTTRMATLTGVDAADFLSSVLTARYNEARSSCIQNMEKVSYHVVVEQKDTESVGYFIVNKCVTGEFNSTVIEYQSTSDVAAAISDGDEVVHSDELFSFLSLGGERSRQ